MLLGYYGYGNAGDEAVLYAIARSLAGQGHRLGVLTASQEQTEALLSPLKVKTFSRFSPSVLRGLLWCDLLLLGGGSLLQDVTGPNSLRYYLGLLKLAKFLGKPYAFFAQGLGPFTRKGSKAKVGESAKGARLLSVRDGQSRQLLRELGAGPVELVADPVWALPADQLAAEAPLREPYILFALRPWQGKEERLCGALEKLRRESRLPFVFAAMQPQCDLPLARRLAAELGGEVAAASDLPALLGYFAQAQLVCAMRLHALIFAALLQRPAVAISYDPKVDALVEELGLAGADLEAPDLEAAVSQATAARPEQVRELKARAASGLEGLAQLGRKLDGES